MLQITLRAALFKPNKSVSEVLSLIDKYYLFVIIKLSLNNTDWCKMEQSNLMARTPLEA